MREIKFRAWLKDEERMVSVSDISFIGEEIDIYENDSTSGDLRGFDCVELMQFTGYKDSDGIDIYEGDIVTCINHNDEAYDSKVYWSGGAFCIDSSACDYDYTAIGFALEMDIYSIEVIGNIYENPELMV